MFSNKKKTILMYTQIAQLKVKPLKMHCRFVVRTFIFETTMASFI